MAYEREPVDPFLFPNDPYRSKFPEGDIRRQSLDNEIAPDSELAKGPAGSGKIAMFAIAIAVVLGAVFYGLNNTSMQTGTTSTAQNTAPTLTPAAPPGMRD